MLEVVTALLLSYSSPNAIPAKVLAPEIIKVAYKHNISPVLLTQILLVESRGVPSAYNAETVDHGLLQINEITRQRYGLSETCVKDWRCNLDAGARILADLLAMDGATVCTYNLGPKGRFEKYKEACNRYERKIASMQLEAL